MTSCGCVLFGLAKRCFVTRFRIVAAIVYVGGFCSYEAAIDEFLSTGGLAVMSNNDFCVYVANVGVVVRSLYASVRAFYFVFRALRAFYSVLCEDLRVSISFKYPLLVCLLP